jgi:hypothetical protein
MTVSTAVSGFWQISRGTPAEVLIELRKHSTGAYVPSIAVDSSGLYHVLIRINSGNEK